MTHETIDEIFQDFDNLEEVDFKLETVTVELADGEKASIPKIEYLDLKRIYGDKIGCVLY